MSKIDLNDPKWVDLIFEGRNKDYGAYKLRQGVPRRNLTALLVVLAVAVAVALFFGIQILIDAHFRDLGDTKSVEYSNMRALPPLSQGDKLSLRQSGKAAHKTDKKFLKFVESLQQEPAKTAVDHESGPGTEPEGESGSGDTNGNGSGVNAAKDGDKDHADELQALPQNTPDNQALNFRIVEQLPEFPGGWVEMMKWLNKNLKYPTAALKKKIEGEVVVSFIINKDGTIDHIKVTKSADPLLDNEALRVVKMMPKWKPGIQNDKPCRTLFAIPVVFQI